MKRVLLIGGVGDGRWVEAVDHDTLFRVPKPNDALISKALKSDPDDPLKIPDLLDIFEEYRIQRIEIIGRRMWIGIAASVYGWDEEKLIVKALFQRDVAAQILGER